MKGSLPLNGRLWSSRSLLLSILFYLFSVMAVQAKTVVIGAGFGFVSVSNMNGLNAGDSLSVKPGVYSGGNFANLKGITITGYGGTVIFNGQVTLNTLIECTISNFQFNNCAGDAFRWDGNSRRCVEKYVSFNNVFATCNDAGNNPPSYNGDTSSLKLYMCVFDSLTLYRTNMLLVGNWGNAYDGNCYMDSIVFSRIKIDSTITDGTEVRGTFFRMDAHDWKVTYKGTNNILGDVGLFYVYGNGSIHNIYKIGGRGYIARLWVVGLKVPQNSYFYNNIDLNCNEYGSIDIKTEPENYTKYMTGGNTYIYNNTAGNKDDIIGYWSSLAVVGEYASPFICEVKNNLGFKLTTRGKPPIAADQSNQTWKTDTSNNMYFSTANGVVDPLTGVPVTNSPVIGKGHKVPWIKDDIYHNPRIGGHDIGAVQHGGAIIAAPPNQPPVAVTGKAQSITLPINTVTLDGTKSYDADGTMKSYTWALTAGTGGTLATPNAATTVVSGLTQGVYIYKLTVQDDSSATASAFDTITVKPAANLPPIANAGADQTITLPVSSMSVDGSASKDQDNGGLISSFAWIQSAGPSTAILTTPTATTSTITGLVQGVYVFKLTVTDASGATSTDSLIVTVKTAANMPPVANAGSSKTVTLPVNTISLDGSLSKDPDGTIASYSWTFISGPAGYTLVNGTAAVATANNLVAGQYIFQLTVTDNSGAVSNAQVKITVVSSGLQPPIANAGANQTITLPLNQVSLDGSSSLAPSGNIVSYSWTQTSGPSTANLSAANAAQTNATNLIAGTYLFYLTIKDNNNATAYDSVIITVNPVANIPPVANAGSSSTLTLPTNSIALDGSKSNDPDGSIGSYSWTQTAGPNTATSTGANTVSLSLTGLTIGQYTFQLKVTDNSGATATALVKVTVVNAPNALPIANAGPDQTITAPSSSVNLDGSASYDPDGTIKTYSWTMTVGAGSITINNGNTANPSVNGLLPGTYTFQLIVTDNSGATASSTANVTVNPKPVLPNQLPIANAGNNLTITAPAGSTGLNGSNSFDPDGTIVSYSWKQTSGPSTAVITNGTSVTPTVSGLIQGSYVFGLTVIDNDGASDKDQVTVTVNPPVNKVNQMPVAMAGIDTTLQLPESTYVLNGNGSHDPDGTIVSYQWQQIGGPSTVDASSMSTAVVDISNLQEGHYEFQLMVTDNQGGTSTSQVTISVDKGSGVQDQLLMYPNPAHDVINGKISSQVTGTIKVSVYDMNGRLVISDQSEKSYDVLIKTLNISTLANGMYMIQINIANRKTMVAKFIKH